MSVRRPTFQFEGLIIPITDHPLFKNMDPGTVESLLDPTMRRGYRRGMFLFVEDEPVDAFYCILGGRIKSYATGPDGRQQILGMYGSGHLLPHSSAFYGTRHTETAEMVKDTVAVRIPVDKFRSMLMDHPVMLKNFSELLERHIHQLGELIRNLSLYSVTQRVARLLRMEAIERGEKVADGYRFRFTLTQQELAQLAGTTRETVSRTLTEFRRSGVLSPGGQGHVHLSLEKLEPYL